MCKLFEYDKKINLNSLMANSADLDILCLTRHNNLTAIPKYKFVSKQLHKAQKDAIWHLFLEIKVEKWEANLMQESLDQHMQSGFRSPAL